MAQDSMTEKSFKIRVEKCAITDAKNSIHCLSLKSTTHKLSLHSKHFMPLSRKILSLQRRHRQANFEANKLQLPKLHQNTLDLFKMETCPPFKNQDFSDTNFSQKSDPKTLVI
jgi:hypothetical protein